MSAAALEGSSPNGSVSRSRIVTFANRLPVTRTAGGWRVTDGGLVAALRPALSQRDASWIGWNPSQEPVPARASGLPIDLVPVALSRRLVDDSYHGFANRTLWPLLHGLVEQPVYERRLWDAYRETNNRFAAADVSGPGIRWVHDYHLMLVPRLLRERGARGPVGFFLHVPFPPTEIFMRLPWREQVLRGLLGADAVSFHTEAYRQSFLQTCCAALDSVGAEDGGLRLEDGRLVRVSTNPISIDARSIAAAALSPAAERHVARLRRRFSRTRVLLGVDRLDYTKGIPERLLALERLFELDKERRGEVTLVQLAVPSRGEIREYQELRSTVERLVGRINGRFTDGSHEPPIHYLYRRLSHEEVLAYFRIADVCLVTPLVDGMNLVAKEFVTAQAAAEGDGGLILSEFTGACTELREALRCNPYDVDGLAGTIGLALELTHDDRRWRLARMAETVQRNDVFAWLQRELRVLEPDTDEATRRRMHLDGGGERLVSTRSGAQGGDRGRAG